MQEDRARIIGGGLMTAKIAEMYVEMVPAARVPWWLSEPLQNDRVPFVTPYGVINTRGGDPVAEYGIRPVLALSTPLLRKGDAVDLVDMSDESQREPFTCIWTLDGKSAMIFCDRVIELAPFRTDACIGYRGSNAERIVLAFANSMEGRQIVIRPAEQKKERIVLV